MAKRPKPRSFDEVLSVLGNEKFDVAPAQEGANRAAGARRVSKYGVAAEIAPSPDADSCARLLARPGWLLGGEIARLTRPRVSEIFEDVEAGDSGDRGYSAGDP